MTANNLSDLFSIQDVEIYRQVKRLALKKEYSAGRCEICLRNEDVLPFPQVLEAHHIVEVCDGGTHDRGNIQIVCTPCHTQIHLRRAYMGLDAEKASEVELIGRMSDIGGCGND